MERRSCFACSCKKTVKPTAATTPIGTLIQKIHGQDQWRMMRAPAIGPSTAESPRHWQIALDFASLARRVKIGDDCHRDRLHGAGADA